jgi:SNF family Na+-dependent transporter
MSLVVELLTFLLVYAASTAVVTVGMMVWEWLPGRKRTSETLTDQDHQHTTRSTNLVRIEVRSERM